MGRGGTSPHITNPVLLHTVPSDNILATICSVNLPFFNKVSLAIKTGYSFTHYISWNPYFPGLLVFSITYHTAWHYMNVCGEPHTPPALPLQKMPSTNWTGQRFGLEALKKWKISCPCQEPTLNYSIIHPGHRLPTTPTALSQLPFYSQSYPEYMCYSCNRLSVQQQLLF